MQRLWHDITDHPFSVALFLVYWLAAWAITYLTWQGGMAPPAVILHLLSAVIAGGLVGWWRAPVREGLLVGRGHLAGGPLAAALVILVDIAFLFGSDWLRDLLHREWKWGGVVEWLVWSAVFGLFGLVLGLLGALAGSTLARVARAGAAR